MTERYEREFDARTALAGDARKALDAVHAKVYGDIDDLGNANTKYYRPASMITLGIIRDGVEAGDAAVRTFRSGAPSHVVTATLEWSLDVLSSVEELTHQMSCLISMGMDGRFTIDDVHEASACVDLGVRMVQSLEEWAKQMNSAAERGRRAFAFQLNDYVDDMIQDLNDTMARLSGTMSKAVVAHRNSESW